MFFLNSKWFSSTRFLHSAILHWTAILLDKYSILHHLNAIIICMQYRSAIRLFLQHQKKVFPTALYGKVYSPPPKPSAWLKGIKTIGIYICSAFIFIRILNLYTCLYLLYMNPLYMKAFRPFSQLLYFSCASTFC